MAVADGTEDALLRSGPLKGVYRRLVALPTAVEWTLDESTSRWWLAEVPRPRLTAMSSCPRSMSGENAVTVSFSLPAGSFATMCLREVLKTDV